MVFVAFLLLTVSSLAVHGREVSKVGPIAPRGCEGKTLCGVKPDDYPQEEIDRYLASNPAQVMRMKRQAELQGSGCEGMGQLENLSKASVDGNCRMEEKCSQPYSMEADSYHQFVVQSKFFSQKIREVRCTPKIPDEPCFQSLVPHKRTKCQQKKMITQIYVFNNITKTVEQQTGEILTDCACVIY